MEDLLCLGLILVFLSDDRAMFVIFGRFTYKLYPSWCNVETDEKGNKYSYCIFGNNKELEEKELYWNGHIFKPELGNKSLEKRYYAELRRLTNKLKNKPNKKPLKTMQRNKKTRYQNI